LVKTPVKHSSRNGTENSWVLLGTSAHSPSPPHKMITTGQGGAVVTNNSEIDHRVRQHKDFCRTKPGEDIHNWIGFNFKFTDLQAVIGLQQLATIKPRMKKKKDIFHETCESTWHAWYSTRSSTKSSLYPPKTSTATKRFAGYSLHRSLSSFPSWNTVFVKRLNSLTLARIRTYSSTFFKEKQYLQGAPPEGEACPGSVETMGQ
jgi:hypothetical protein